MASVQWSAWWAYGENVAGLKPAATFLRVNLLFSIWPLDILTLQHYGYLIFYLLGLFAIQRYLGHLTSHSNGHPGPDLKNNFSVVWLCCARFNQSY